ncbi:MarR family winged helix-turn-helix transcriptional regulator [Novosphingobium cyanobacteriorum]|uniref:MarR family transcriptional regulator n=1 Tax=Novosphingobium cyanobacteriorum TaxID=3024215 RepID=A0ABT6CKG1_9SPHN|nr:MarR family transcriptional regulator [Novosphingobium cyanobacteriorum]MDF8333753.1 MarR family transcriptional regulator [Novosphingobium cyanobacteriorum]
MQSRSLPALVWISTLSLHGDIYNRLNRAMVRECGLTLAKYDVLAQLHGNPEGLTLGALTRKLKVTGGNVTGLAKRLVAEGLATREMAPHDRRSFIARITPQGSAAFEAARTQHDALLQEWMDGLTEAELARALASLDQIRAALDRRMAGADTVVDDPDDEG